MVTEVKSGEITFSQIGKIPQTGETYGLITVRVSDDEEIKLKIDDDTKFKKLKIGSEVTVSFDASGDSKVPIANSIVILH
jgi:hypothetical protein